MALEKSVQNSLSILDGLIDGQDDELGESLTIVRKTLVAIERRNQRSMPRRPAKPSLPPAVRKSLDEVVSYLWDDELRHAQENGLDPRHVFCHLVRVDNWLNQRMAKPEDYLETDK